MDEILLIEALLFSSGKPFSIKQLGEALELEPEIVRKCLKRLKGFYGKRNTAIEIAKVGSKYCLQVKRDYLKDTTQFVATKIPRKLLKTLAYIAYYQPIKQSEMVNAMGPRIYVEVKKLKEFGLIHRKRSGNTKILSTTSKFPEYFGIGTSTKEGIKQWLSERFGMNTEELPVIEENNDDSERNEEGDEEGFNDPAVNETNSDQ